MSTCQFVNATFKNIVLVKFNMMIKKIGVLISQWIGTGFNIDSGSDENRVKTPESLLSQAMELNYKVKIQDRNHVRV